MTRPRTPRRRSAVAAVAAVLSAAGAAAALATADGAAATPSDSLVIGEAYGGGGNSGATLTNDFVELFQRGGTAQDLTGWSVQYISASPGATTTWQVTPLTGSVAPGARYLVQEAKGSGGTTPLPTPDATGTINMSGSSGTVALVDSTTALSCRTAADCAADPAVVDLVGWGSAVIHEGGADAPATSNTTSVQRDASGTDTDDNGADLTAAAPTPAAGPGGDPGPSSSTDPTSAAPQPGPVRIHDIQGAGWVSPLAGSSVTDVPGIVTAVRTAGSSKGFWFQDPNPDADPATSEGVFVYTGSRPTVAPGDSVLVSGKVSDYYPLSSGETTSSTSNLSVTEIGTPTVTTLAQGVALPAPVVLTPTTVPATHAPDLGGGNVENTPVTPTRSALDFYESVEGMRVEVDNARVVGPSNVYGEQYVTTTPNQDRTYRGGTYLPAEDATPSGRLEVVTADGSDPGVDVGDVFGGATTGPVDWSRFGGYTLVAQTLGTVDRGGLAPVVATPGSARQLSIATYNVENLAPTDPASKFASLARGVVTNLASPDIVALEEVQDDTGATDDGTTAADVTITMLTDAIAAAGGPHYDYREIDPVNDRDGGQPGGNIRNVFLFDPTRVSFVDSGSGSVDRSTTATEVTGRNGRTGLTLSPGRIDPTDPVWSSSRKPLVGQFRFRGKDVFVIGNHFDAKLGDGNADGRFQYPTRSSEVQRAGQAAAVHDFVASLLDADRKADVVVLGDLNDYQFSPALRVLTTGSAAGTGSPILTDLISTLPADQQYTYVYNGVSQVLDHILTTGGFGRTTYQVVHVNSEFAAQSSDHDPQVVDLTP